MHGVGDARERRRLRFDLTALLVVFALLVGAIGATGVIAYQHLYSPTAFVLRYLELLTQGRAADALTVPGVVIDSVDLEDAKLPTTASEALLRRDALAPLTEVEAVRAEESDGITKVTVSYKAGPHEGTSTFEVERAGWVGVAPTWRFAQSPLAVIDLSVRGAMQFSVNGFEVDKRQVSVDGVEADPLAAVPLLVFSPGLYSVQVKTALSESPGVAVLSDTPQAAIPVDVQTEPTDEFIGVVQDKVEAFLTECATQEVLQPTGCPFGTFFENRVVSTPTWKIAKQPTVALAPNGADWKIRRTQAIAEITVDIQSLYDGSIQQVVEEVPFFLTGDITVLPDGSASIQVSPSD